MRFGFGFGFGSDIGSLCVRNVLIIFLITLLVLFVQNSKKDTNNIGIACSSTNNCTNGLQCSHGYCSIPALGECTGYESNCANGAQCSNGICDSILPAIPPITPITPNKPSEICQSQTKLIQDEEALNAFNLNLINQRDQMLGSIMDSNLYDINQLEQQQNQLDQLRQQNQYLTEQLQQCYQPQQVVQPYNTCPCR